MPIATLRFRLPEEQEEFDYSRQGTDCYLALWDLDQYLRSRLKHESLIGEDASSALDKAREKLREVCQDRGISL